MSKNRRFLEKVSQAPGLQTHLIDPGVARKSPILFGFKHLDINKKPFHCSEGNGGSLLYIFSTMKIFSEVIRMNLEISYPNCHEVPSHQINKHNLNSLVFLAPNRKLHQLGRKRTKERIIGYFDSPLSNLFQVCLLDLNHNLSGD